MELIRTAGLDLVVPVEVLGGVAGLVLGDCLEVLRMLPDNCVDSIVTDPPYGLSFMGKRWDYDVPGVDVWAECLRVLKPGGHLLAFAGTRTQHRMAVRIEDAGFEIRDMIAWVYGSGFPKSLDVSKAIDKARTEDIEPIRIVCRAVRAAMEVKGLKSRDLTQHFGDCHPRLVDHWAARDTDSQPVLPTWEQWEALRDLLDMGGALDAEVWRLNRRKGTPGDNWQNAEVVGEHSDNAPGNNMRRGLGGAERDPLGEIKAPATDAARQWQGWGTALKPALEPITVARKPLIGTVAANVLAHGTGAINVDGCRVGDEDMSGQFDREWKQDGTFGNGKRASQGKDCVPGRWPANLIHDGSDEVLAAFPQSNGQRGAVTGEEPSSKVNAVYGAFKGRPATQPRGGAGSAARFFYCAKASRSDRNEGCEAFEKKPLNWSSGTQNPGSFQSEGTDKAAQNNHLTVKPTDLMRYLCRLVTPPGGVVLDPFMGSGSTGKAAVMEGFRFVGCELSPEYMAIASARILHAVAEDLAG